MPGFSSFEQYWSTINSNLSRTSYCMYITNCFTFFIQIQSRRLFTKSVRDLLFVAIVTDNKVRFLRDEMDYESVRKHDEWRRTRLATLCNALWNIAFPILFTFVCVSELVFGAKVHAVVLFNLPTVTATYKLTQTFTCE